MREGSELSISKRDIINECLRASVCKYTLCESEMRRKDCCHSLLLLLYAHECNWSCACHQTLYVDASELEKQDLFKYFFSMSG